MRKITILFIVGILILSGLTTTALFEEVSFASTRDELDQSQTVMTENMVIPVGNVQLPNITISVQIAQSFIPTKDILTRVELFIIKNLTVTYPLSISIREELTNDNLTALDIDPSVVPTEDLDWIEINFDDIVVTTGRTYYIVAITENVTDNFYGWGANNLSESYPDGCMWYSIDEGDTWSNKSVSSKPSSFESHNNNQYPQPIFEENLTWDMCFKTYGFDNLPPNVPVISGPNCGKPNIEYEYSFNATDPEGDAIMYIIEWGDNNTEWTEYGDSGIEILLKHTWTGKGNYTIKAKAIDFHGAESEWAELVVTMPRDKSIQKSPFPNFLQNYLQSHPNLFPILQQLFQRFGL